MASSSSSSTLVRTYDVFLSFRGEDTRNTIVSHLYHALRLKGLFTFKDDVRIELGDNISARLLEAIETSWFAVVIISLNHATSSWCLEELRRIMELHKENQIEVVPIFYGVEPSDVRKQTGSFEAAFQKYNESPEMSEKVLKWRDALVQVGDLAGMHSSQGVDEAEMIAKVVGSISTRLRIIKPTEMMNVVGMEAHMERLNPLLSMESEDEVRMIGIWGMGGIGKTTIAKCLYARFSHQYQACCFMENVSKMYNGHSGGVRQLQVELLSVITRDADIKLWSAEAGSQEIKSRLEHTKVFLVLDGVDKVEQIRALANETSWFGLGSRIIITTRDRGLLNASGVCVHKVKCLDDKDALQIFKQTAFRGGIPHCDGFEHLSVRASQLAHSLPSALVAFGEHLSQIAISDWKEELDILETSPHEDVQNILMTSYNGLDQEHQIIFLHVACLFNGGYLQHITTFLDNSNSRIKRLVTKSLIDITMDGCVNMHFLVVQVGREIVCKESGGTPSKQRFLWDTNQIRDALEDNIGSDKLFEGLALHLCEMADRLPTRSNGLSTMNNLKFLKFFQHMGDRDIINLQLGGHGLSNKLKLLHWDSYPSATLPIIFRMDNLVEINLRNSNLVHLWNEPHRLPSLRRLYLTGSKNLIKLPDLSTAVNLEELMMDGCTSLREIQGFINGLNLKKLNMIHCDSLKDLLYVTLRQETNTSRRGCHKIIVRSSDITVTETFPIDLSIEGKISAQLWSLIGYAEHLSFGSKQQIPDQWMTTEQKPVTPQLMSDSNSPKSLAIKQITYMEHRAPFGCHSFSNFPCLTELKLINLNIEVIPDDICYLQLLETLHLCGNDFIYLPKNMGQLANLKYLSLRNCRRLKTLPQLTQVETLILSNCVNLRSLLELDFLEDHATYCLLELLLENCKRVQSLSESLSRFTKLTCLDLSRHDFQTMPESISELSSLGTLFLDNCKKLKSLEDLPLGLKYLYAHGCKSLLNFSFSSNRSIKHIDLSHCLSLNHKEDLIHRFLSAKDRQMVAPAFICLPRTIRSRCLEFSQSRMKFERVNVPPSRIVGRLMGFIVFLEIVCEEPLHLQFPAFSSNWNWETGRVLRIDIKPHPYLSMEMQMKKDASSYHMVTVYVQNSINNEDDVELEFEVYLLLPEETHFPNAEIIRCQINFCNVRMVFEENLDVELLHSVDSESYETCESDLEDLEI